MNLLAALIFFAATGVALWWFNKSGERVGGCAGAMLLMVFTTGFGLLVLVLVSLILKFVSGGAINM